MNKLFRIFNESQQSHHFGKNWKAAEDIVFKVGSSIVKLSACLSSLSQESAKLNHRNRRKKSKAVDFLVAALHFAQGQIYFNPNPFNFEKKIFFASYDSCSDNGSVQFGQLHGNIYLIIILFNQQLPRDAGERGGRGEHHGRHAGGHPAQRP